ncbi:MAG: FAD:protein FMN transferase [Oscillospiraceae bacterium]
MKKKLLAAVTVLTLLLGLTACSPQKTEVKKREASFLTLFDTVTTVVGYAESDESFKQIVQSLHDDLQSYHQLFDIYNEYDGVNNIKSINDNAGIKPVKVDKRIIDLLSFAKEVYVFTNGKVNVAMGSVLSIWHNYRTEGIDNPQTAKIPPVQELEAAAKLTDINKVIIDGENSTVFLEDKGMSLDVGAIAKGYAVQRVCEAAKDRGIDRFLISVGGNVSSIGAKSVEGDPWVVGIQSPYDAEEYQHTVFINDAKSVVTSGNYQRFYTVDGVKYHHIIDPVTLMPANNFDAVTIICGDSGLADALSTALYVMSLEDGRALIESIDNAEAVWIVDGGTEIYSSGFESYIRT